MAILRLKNLKHSSLISYGDKLITFLPLGISVTFDTVCAFVI